MRTKFVANSDDERTNSGRTALSALIVLTLEVPAAVLRGHAAPSGGGANLSPERLAWASALCVRLGPARAAHE